MPKITVHGGPSNRYDPVTVAVRLDPPVVVVVTATEVEAAPDSESVVELLPVELEPVVILDDPVGPKVASNEALSDFWTALQSEARDVVSPAPAPPVPAPPRARKAKPTGHA